LQVLWRALLVKSGLLAGAQAFGAADYVGAATCRGCHQQAALAWQGSHHEAAMKVASSDTVLGDFNDATITQIGVTSRFYTLNDCFIPPISRTPFALPLLMDPVRMIR
jgi:hypothetical protein